MAAAAISKINFAIGIVVSETATVRIIPAPPASILHLRPGADFVTSNNTATIGSGLLTS